MNSTANDRQVGGEHYKATPYQHWDFAIDTCMPYMEGQISKYIDRHRRKRGLEDVEKAGHFLQKLREAIVEGRAYPPSYNYDAELVRYYECRPEMTTEERGIISTCLTWRGTAFIDAALGAVERLKTEYGSREVAHPPV